MIPKEMKNMNNWIVFKFENGKNGRTNKIPFSPLYDGHASSTNPNTWSNYLIAYDCMKHKGFHCLGFAITEPYIFIDIDSCVTESGELSEVAKDIVVNFPNSYIEWSQSGKGLHIITKGTIPRASKTSEVEIYSSGRFIAITGNTIQENEPQYEQNSIDYVFEKYKTPDLIESVSRPIFEVTKTDLEIIELLCRDDLAKELFEGNWQGRYESQSQADLVLCSKIAFWVNRDFDRIDRIFSQSGLFRKKWNRKDYKKWTIERAISGCAICFDEWKNEREEDTTWRTKLNQLRSQRQKTEQ